MVVLVMTVMTIEGMSMLTQQRRRRGSQLAIKAVLMVSSMLASEFVGSVVALIAIV
jgi:hypothetical protein